MSDIILLHFFSCFIHSWGSFHQVAMESQIKATFNYLEGKQKDRERINIAV